MTLTPNPKNKKMDQDALKKTTFEMLRLCHESLTSLKRQEVTNVQQAQIDTIWEIMEELEFELYDL